VVPGRANLVPAPPTNINTSAEEEQEHGMSSITIGLIGAGGIARAHLPGWVAQGIPVVIYSEDGRAGELAARYDCRAVQSLEELLATADIVDICTPSSTHRELTERAAAAGKHVICEKPLALTVADANAMISACERAGVRLLPAHVVRYFPAYAAARKVVEQGGLGALAVQRFARISAMPEQPWFAEDELSGGIAMDQMIHDFDFARWISGPVGSVYATRVDREAPGGGSTVQAILTHTSGAISHVHGVWGAPITRFQSTFSITGTGGTLEHDSLAPASRSFDLNLDTASVSYLPPVSPGESPFTTELRDFADAIVHGRPARVAAEDGLEGVRIAVAVNESITTRSAVTIEESQ
jgi:predicted dehydrogenase